MVTATKSVTDRSRHLLATPGVYKLGLWLIGKIPKRLSYMIAAVVGDVTRLFYRTARESVRSNLKLVFPDADGGHIDGLTGRVFRNYSRYLVDYGRFRSLDKESLFKEVTRVDGTENVETALDRGKGLILLTAHLGNWELGGIFFGRQDLKINVLTVRDTDVAIDEIREMYRDWHNINTIVLGDSPFSILEVTGALGRGEIVAMLVDRPVDEAHGEVALEVDFFGRPWKMPAGPMHLAKMTGAPIMPAFTVTEGDRYRAVAEDLIYVDSDDENGERRAAEKVVAVFEDYIRKYPDQWYNFEPV
jgi:KDO2-lipid IV(A) lauroyltransferase